jgi:hypothetical protein
MMAITQDQVTAQEESLRARLHLSGDTLEIDGIGSRAVRPPAPSRLLLEGRKVRARRRLAAGSFAAAASVVVAGAGAGVAGGAFKLPWLGAEGTVSPGTLYASSGTKVGDVVNAMDDAFNAYEVSADPYGFRTWLYRSGPLAKAVTGEEAEMTVRGGDDLTGEEIRAYEDRVRRAKLQAAQVDRLVELRASNVTADLKTLTITARLAQTRPGTDEELSSRDLGSLSLGADGRGRWMQVRPSAADGWLVLATLPENAEAVQVRVTGTDVVLPLDSDHAAAVATCLDEGGPTATEAQGILCHAAPRHVVRLRIATTDAAPPIDAITYVDEDGKYVVLGSEALVH